VSDTVVGAVPQRVLQQHVENVVSHA
jgi:hypothetical protein